MRFDELLESGELVSRIDTISELTGVQIEVDRQLLSEIRKDSADILNKDPLVTDLRNRLFRLLDTMASMYGPDDSNRVGSVHEQVTHKRKIFDADVMTDTMMQSGHSVKQMISRYMPCLAPCWEQRDIMDSYPGMTIWTSEC